MVGKIPPDPEKCDQTPKNLVGGRKKSGKTGIRQRTDISLEVENIMDAPE